MIMSEDQSHAQLYFIADLTLTPGPGGKEVC